MIIKVSENATKKMIFHSLSPKPVSPGQVFIPDRDVSNERDVQNGVKMGILSIINDDSILYNDSNDSYEEDNYLMKYSISNVTNKTVCLLCKRNGEKKLLNIMPDVVTTVIVDEDQQDLFDFLMNEDIVKIIDAEMVISEADEDTSIEDDSTVFSGEDEFDFMNDDPDEDNLPEDIGDEDELSEENGDEEANIDEAESKKVVWDVNSQELKSGEMEAKEVKGAYVHVPEENKPKPKKRGRPKKKVEDIIEDISFEDL